MRDITKLHPELQEIIPRFIKECASAGYIIKIGECVRSVSEQDELYAIGRTTGTKGKTVTNCKGSNYGSLHIWGVAFDFFLDMDVDKDGSKSDDAFNDKTGIFTKVGQIGKKYGLTWGGDFRSIHDSPHFQITKYSPDCTASYLKKKYGTPDKFKADWIVKPSRTVTKVSAKGEIKWLQTNLNKYITDPKFKKLKISGQYDKDTINAVLLYWEQIGWNKDKDDDGTRAGAKTLFALETGKTK